MSKLDECIYPECTKDGTLICTCCFVPWCKDHIDNHYEAMKNGISKGYWKPE